MDAPAVHVPGACGLLGLRLQPGVRGVGRLQGAERPPNRQAGRAGTRLPWYVTYLSAGAVTK